MAYSAHVSPLERSTADGRNYVSVTITETNVTDSSEWVVSCLPPFFTIVLFESEITDQPSAADTTIHPRLTTAPGATPAALSFVAQNQTPAATIRNAGGVRVVSPQRKLYGRSQAPTGIVVPTVVTRLFLVEGMDTQTAVAAEAPASPARLPLFKPPRA